MVDLKLIRISLLILINLALEGVARYEERKNIQY